MKIVQKIDLKELVENNINSQDIFSYYLGNDCFKRNFCSPLRKDNNPSASVYMSKTGELRFKDFGDGENLSAIGFVQKLYNLSYSEALKKIASDFNLTKVEFKAQIIEKKEIEIPKKQPKIIQFQPKQFTEADLAYWGQYDITLDILKFYNVYSVSKLWVNKQRYSLKKDELCYAFFFPKSNHVKIYRPFAEKKYKFLGNVTNDEDVLGHWQVNPKVSKPKLLIMTKSYKECMFFHKFGIHAVALNGENHLPNSDYIRHLKKYCKEIRVLYDKDEAGIKGCQKIKELFDINCIMLPEECDYKDITDWYSKGNKEDVINFINKIKAE